MHDSRHSLNGNAGLSEFGSEHAPADMTTSSSGDGRAPADDARSLASFRAGPDALAGFVSEKKESAARVDAPPALALLSRAGVDDVRRTGCASDIDVLARTAVDDIRAQILRRAMHIVCFVLVVALAMLAGAGAVFVLATRQLAPATPVTSGAAQSPQP